MVVAMRKALVTAVTLALLAGCASAPQPLQLVAAGSLTYPEAARTQGVEGLVVVRYDVDVTGTVVNARVVEAEPPDTFERAALDFVLSWRFQPVEVDGRTIVVEDNLSEIAFRLDDGRADIYP